MKLLIINGGTSGSSWSICKAIANNIITKGWECILATPNKKPNDCPVDYFRFENNLGRSWNRFVTHIDGSDGFRNHSATKRLQKFIEKEQPDIVHIHTIHGYCINIEKLILFLNKAKIKTVITLHDCWWFTGRCAHFYSNGCDKWQTVCNKCKYKQSYPKSFIVDKTKKHHLKKIKLLNNSPGLVVTCVSNWLLELSKKSPVFTGKTVRIIHNGVDETVFYDNHNNIQSNYTVLSVASEWTKEKGADILVSIASKFPTIDFYVAGNTKNKFNNLANVKAIGTVDSKTLADYYNRSDVYLNLSSQETFALTNIEAQLCGTPVICLNQTGMKETICPTDSMMVGSWNAKEYIKCLKVASESDFDNTKIKNFAKRFSLKNMNEQYFSLYQEIVRN